MARCMTRWVHSTRPRRTLLLGALGLAGATLTAGPAHAGDLAVVLSSRRRRAALVNDCVALVERRVDDAPGLSGTVIRAGFAAVGRLDPELLPVAVNALLPAWIRGLRDLWAEGERQGSAVEHLTRERGAVAHVLLGVVDRRIRSADNNLLRRTYARLRPLALDHVEDGVPAVAALLAEHAR